MKIIIGTTSTIKINALKETISQYRELLPSLFNATIISYDVESLVPDTPYNAETLQGARNRAVALTIDHTTEGEYFVGLESGLVEREGAVFEECWCVIYDNEKNEYLGYSSGFMLPKNVTEHMNRGKTHIEALNILSKELGLNVHDTWSIYSHGLVSRAESIKEAFRNALLSLPVPEKVSPL